eukprot:2404890-Rhodomonas_salina.1
MSLQVPGEIGAKGRYQFRRPCALSATPAPRTTAPALLHHRHCNKGGRILCSFAFFCSKLSQCRPRRPAVSRRGSTTACSMTRRSGEAKLDPG